MNIVIIANEKDKKNGANIRFSLSLSSSHVDLGMCQVGNVHGLTLRTWVNGGLIL